MSDELWSFCRNTCVRVIVSSMHSFHSGLSKAKKGSVSDLVTGGSWKKSPVTTNYACTFSLNCRFEDSRNAPVCPQMGVRGSSANDGRWMRACQIGAHPPSKLGLDYSRVLDRVGS